THGLRFDGLMGYEGHTLAIPDQEQKRQAIRDAIGRLLEARRAVEGAGLTCKIVSAGGSGSYQITSELPGLTELQAGGAIVGCMYYLQQCRIEGHSPALRVLATVVSRPRPDLAILDSGRKTLSDHGAQPALPNLPGARILGLSAEHATVEVDPESPLPIGSKVEIIPGYSDLTFVLQDRVLATRNEVVEAVWPLLARGMLQ
ncbi:MAG TPA: DSD1 family PLP-dependent enzyme, partial [Isosphaeraceae bacterium]|nr:DSD1 family PLP-dependent enzyme [Isosphaeraceae bacterium]